MAGPIAKLFGGLLRPRPPQGSPLGEVEPGLGGYAMPSGPAGQAGFPGSTSATRTFKNATPRSVGIRADTNVGWESGLSSTPQVRQVPRTPGVRTRNPRQSPAVTTPQPELTRKMQNNSPAEWYGGQPLSTQPGYDLAGQNPLRHAEASGGHSVRETETPATQRQPMISGGAPGGVPGGSGNVRNTIAQRYKNVPGEMHTYQSAPRGDMEKQGIGTEGVAPGDVETTSVTVPSRFVFDGGGVQSWSVERQMPYTGRGDGARGADLNGQRYYGLGGYDNFSNAGQGSYGKSRLEGPNHRPTNFQQPAPWSAQYYDTTDSVGTQDQAGTNAQSPNLVYVSPSSGRATNGTGRTG